MKKKFLALVLTLAMVLSLVPVTALATEGTPTPDNATESVTTSQDGVNITKQVVSDGDGNYNLVMEAYVEGTTTTTTSTKPLDIVLVLDVSGSMDGSMGNIKRIDALKNAVNGFITEVAKNNPATEENPVGHRISIVKFAGNKSTEIGDDTYTEESGIWPFIETNTYNYSQIVKNLTAVNDAGKEELIDAVNALKPAGATQADYGMELAKDELKKNSTDQSRDKVVVMFTDGTPTSGSSFESSVASDAISASKALKDKDVKVYTIGIFSGANPKEEVTKNKTSAENKYMHAVSSNYPHATLDWKQTGYFSGEWQWNFGTRAKGSNYYLSATSADGLNKVFQTISDSITTTHVKANASAVLRDTLTEQFVLNGDANKITVQTAAVTGKDADGEYTWAKELEDVDGITKNVSGKTVTVTGFDYTSKDNVITKTGEVYSGHKLIVTIPIKVDEAYEGWEAGTKNYDTNTTGDNNKAGLTGYTKGTDTNASTLLDRSPQVPVPTYQVIYDWGTSGVTTPVTDSWYYISGKNATVDYTTVKKGDAVKGSNDKLYRFSGWSENGTDIVDTVEIKDRDVTLTPVLTEAYTVTYTDGVDGEEIFADQVYSNLISGEATPRFDGALIREGYRFTGWKPTVAENVTGNATYTAQWQKLVEGEVVVTIAGKNNTVKYDGTEKSVFDYDVTITQNEGDTTYTENDFTFSGTAEAKGTDVKDGGYSMGLKAEDFVNQNSQFTNVTFEVVDGKLTIQPRTVKMTSGSDTKPWDDNALTNDTVTVTGDGFVEGQGATYNVTGSQTDVGESDNTFTYTLKDGTTASNYDITTEFGKLTITEKAEVPYTLIFDANDGAWDEEISGYALNTKKNQATKSGLAASYRVDTSTVTAPKKENATFLGWGTTESILPNLILKPTVAALKNQLDLPSNTVTLYAVWKTEETTDPAGNCTYTIRQHYWKNLNDTDTGDNVSIKNLTAKSDEKIASLIDGKDKDQDWRGYRYLYDNQQTTVTVPGEESTKLTDGAVLSVSGTVIDLYYYLDSWKDGNTQDPAGKDEKTGGDGIPDYKQILIEYKAHTPLVGEVSCEFEIQTLKDNQTVATPTGAKATAKTDSVYAFAYWIKGEVDPKKTEAEIENTAICYENQLSGVTIDPVTGGETYIYTAVFLKDVTGKIEEGKEKPDGIPDAWQCKVTFKVVNGNWNDNTNKDIVRYVTKKNAEGKGSTNGTAKLTTDQIPPVGNQPNSGYTTSGNWDKTPSAVEITKDTVFTYTYDKKSGGSGGSGGSHKPTVTIPDDVPTGLNGKDHYAYVVGYPDGMVYPQKNITRAEVATIFFRLLTDETREANMTKSNSYNDMKDGAWYTCAVSTLSKMGIIKGYEDGSFKPDASISRAEFAAIAARFDPDGDKTPATFSDVSSHWAKDEISIAANHGWIKGYEDGSFKPDQKITRAETMTLVNRVLKRLPETKDDLHKDMKTWPDNQKESAWFYLAVQEATNSHYQKLKKDGTHETWESMRETRDWAALEK